ncbi:sugar-binding protein [Fibrobacterota bacterium]
MLRNITVAACALTLLAGAVSGQILRPYFMKAPMPVTADGVLDEWYFVHAIDFKTGAVNDYYRPVVEGWLPASDTDCSGKFRWMWDETNLYISVEVTDDVPAVVNTITRRDETLEVYDGIEVYFSTARLEFEATHGFAHDRSDNSIILDGKLRIYYDLANDRWSIRELWYLNDSLENTSQGVVVDSLGYTLEVVIPWASLESPNGNNINPVPGEVFSFGLSLYDTDVLGPSGVPDFDGYQLSVNPLDASFQEYWACEIIDRDSMAIEQSRPYCKKVLPGREPVIDGNLDDWYFAFPVEINHKTVMFGDPPFETDSLRDTAYINEDFNTLVHIMWDDDYFYLGYESVDDVPGKFAGIFQIDSLPRPIIDTINVDDTTVTYDTTGFDSTIDTSFVFDNYWDNDGLEFMIRTVELADTTTVLLPMTYDEIVDWKLRLAYNKETGHWRFCEEYVYPTCGNDNPDSLMTGDKVWVETETGYVIESRIPWASLTSPEGISWDFEPGRRMSMFWGLADMDSIQGEPLWLSISGSWNDIKTTYTIVDILGPHIAEEPNQDFVPYNEVKEAFPGLNAPFKLFANYPNPFRSTTRIAFSIGEPQRVELSVYDLMQRKVLTVLDNQEMSAGRHDVSFNAESLSSGIYFYRLTREDGASIIKSMTIIK